jgi:hypothetical protein
VIQDARLNLLSQAGTVVAAQMVGGVELLEKGGYSRPLATTIMLILATIVGSALLGTLIYVVVQKNAPKPNINQFNIDGVAPGGGAAIESDPNPGRVP